MGRLIDALGCPTGRLKAMNKALDAVELFPTFFRINLLSSSLVLSGIYYNGSHYSVKIAG